MSDSDLHPFNGPGPDDRERDDVVRALPTTGGEAAPALEIPPQVAEKLDILKEACGSNLVCVVFFGSWLLGTSPDLSSAADLFVVIDDYRSFYREIGERLPAARRASIMAALNRVLPPSIIHLRDPGDLGAGAKCFVISASDLAVALSNRAKDNFCRGRLVQRVHIVYARSAEDHERLENQLEKARRASLDWVPLYLGETFSVPDYCRRMLEVSYAGEIRPESKSRVQEVFDAQRSYFRLMYGRILDEAADEGRLERVEGGYHLTTPISLQDRIGSRLFFAKSKWRATLRWVKHMLTFEDWLDYIVRKAERRTGIQVELTRAQRRLPALLLWPKVAKVLWVMRSGPQAGNSDDEPPSPSSDRSDG